MEEIPNKVKDVLGILVDVNLHNTNQGDYLEIVVEPYPNAVNYKGQYHYRSGSTKQKLKGAALDKFLLQKKGKHWDSAPIPNVCKGQRENYEQRLPKAKRLFKKYGKQRPDRIS